jgi:hypothetical protein
MICGALASASSTVCPSTPGAPLLRTTLSSAFAKLASHATSSSSRLVSAASAAGPLVFLLLALCSRTFRRPDASGGSPAPPPEGLSANARLNCRGPVFLNPSPPLLRRLSPASSLLRGDPTSASASSRRRCLLRVYREGNSLADLCRPPWVRCTGCPAAAVPTTDPTSVGLWASRSWARSPGRTRLLRASLAFGAAVRLGLLPHTASRPQEWRLTTASSACSCLRLAVATNSPREGLSPPIQCPCQAHPCSLAKSKLRVAALPPPRGGAFDSPCAPRPSGGVGTKGVPTNQPCASGAGRTKG